MSLMRSRNEKRDRLEAAKPRPKRSSSLELILGAVPSGREIALSFARQIAIRDERFTSLLRDYDANPLLDLGDLCETHKILPADFMAEVNKEVFPYMDEAVKLAQAASMKVVAKRLTKVVERGYIEGAKSGGVTDRHEILMKEGFHVAPKGNTINLNQINAGGGVPSFEEETRELSSILQTEDDYLLGPAEEEFIEASEIEEEEKVPA